MTAFLAWLIGYRVRRWWGFYWYLKPLRPLLIVVTVSKYQHTEQWCRPIWSH